jgi:hypothetical protein
MNMLNVDVVDEIKFVVAQTQNALLFIVVITLRYAVEKNPTHSNKISEIETARDV